MWCTGTTIRSTANNLSEECVDRRTFFQYLTRMYVQGIQFHVYLYLNAAFRISKSTALQDECPIKFASTPLPDIMILTQFQDNKMDSTDISLYVLLNGCSIILHLLSAHILRTMISPENSKNENTVILIFRRLNIFEVLLGSTRIVFHVLQLIAATSAEGVISEQHQYAQQCYSVTIKISCVVQFINVFFACIKFERFIPRRFYLATTALYLKNDHVEDGGYKTLELCLAVNGLVCALMLFFIAMI